MRRFSGREFRLSVGSTAQKPRRWLENNRELICPRCGHEFGFERTQKVETLRIEHGKKAHDLAVRLWRGG